MQAASCDLESHDADAIEARGETYHWLFPDGQSLLASISLQAGRSPFNEPALYYLSELEHRVYAEIEGHGRSFAILAAKPDYLANDQDLARSFLRFEFSPDQIAALRAGADLGFGIDDDRMRVGARVKSETRASLLAELG